MKYENAKDMLPSELLKQVQKYAAGKLLYIPQKEEPKAWGSVSGSRQKLLKRNQRIYNEYALGKGIRELAEEYFLSIDSIKKIVYGKKQECVPFDATSACAVSYSEMGLDEEWIRTYFVTRFGEGSFPEQWLCDGLVKIPLRLIDEVKDTLGCGCDNPLEPMVIVFENGKFVFQGKESLLGQLKENKVNSHHAFIFVPNVAEYGFYLNQFSKQFHQAKL